MADTLAWLVENQHLRAENERLRAVLEDLAKAFAHDGDIHFHAQPVAYRREQIRKALDGEAIERGTHPCDQCGSTLGVRYIPDPECHGVHAWYACSGCVASASAPSGANDTPQPDRIGPE